MKLLLLLSVFPLTAAGLVSGSRLSLLKDSLSAEYSYLDLDMYRGTTITKADIQSDLDKVDYVSDNGIFHYYFKGNLTSSFYKTEIGFELVQFDNYFKPGYEYKITIKNPDVSNNMQLNEEYAMYVTDFSYEHYEDIYSEDSISYTDYTFKIIDSVPNQAALFTYPDYVETVLLADTDFTNNSDSYFNSWIKRYNGFSYIVEDGYYLIDSVASRLYDSSLIQDPDKGDEDLPAAISDLQEFAYPNLNYYKNGLSPDPKLLQLLETKEGDLCIYVYRTDKSARYDVVDLSVSLDLNSDQYNSRRLTVVSFSDYIVKYKIENVKIDLSTQKRRYAVREVYNSETRDSIKSIIPVGLEYLVAYNDVSGKYETSTNIVDYTIITDKKVGFQLYPMDSNFEYDKSSLYYKYLGEILTTSHYSFFMQSNYIAFSTNIDLAKLVAVEVNYDKTEYVSSTDIGVNLTDLNNDGFKNNFHGKENFVETRETRVTKNLTEKVEPDHVRIQSRDNWLFWNVRNYEYDTIARPSDVENINDEFLNYDWIVRFSEKELGIIRFLANVFDYKYAVYGYQDLSEVSIMKLWHEVDGEIKELLVVDTYAESEGNDPVTNDPIINIFQKMIEAWIDIFSGKFSLEAVVYAILSVVFVAAGLFLLGLIFKFVKFLVGLFHR